MIGLVADTKNFALGALDEGMRRTGRWSRWAFGFHGISYKPALDGNGTQFSHLNMGGLLLPAIVVGLMMGGVGPFLAVWLGGTIASAALGMVTGAISGGWSEMSQERELRLRKQEAREHARDRAELQTLQQKAQTIQSRIHTRQERAENRQRGSWVDRITNERSAPRERSRQ